MLYPDHLPVSHACVVTGLGDYRRVVPFVAPLTKEDRVNALMAAWDI